MPDLSFRILDTAVMPYAAIPTIAASLQIANADPSRAVHSISLNCQVQIEPLGRSYTVTEEAKLLDLFGERDRWARTMQTMLWTNAVLKVAGFTTETVLDLPLPCTFDFDVAATKYFYSLDTGNISISVLFSGTVFYEGDNGVLQVMQIPWDREAKFKLPASVWRAAIAAHYPDSAWLRLSKESFDRLYRFKVGRGISSWEQVLQRLLDRAELAEVEQTLAAVELTGKGAPQ